MLLVAGAISSCPGKCFFAATVDQLSFTSAKEGAGISGTERAMHINRRPHQGAACSKAQAGSFLSSKKVCAGWQNAQRARPTSGAGGRHTCSIKASGYGTVHGMRMPHLSMASTSIFASTAERSNCQWWGRCACGQLSELAPARPCPCA